jgi:caa(3)-type oxidase subunit IV
MSDHHNDHSHSHHYILPDSKAVKTGIALLFLTAVTVGLSFVHLGPLNFIVGMIVATLKASLVAGIFMNLSKDRKSNMLIFLTSFLFLGIFVILASTDLLFRGDVYVKGPLIRDTGVSKFKKGWEPTPELVAHGKAVFAQQCVSCHGDTGNGKGPAAAALNPPPRNFHTAEGWKNGRKPSQIFKTLKEGIAGGAMASFATLPMDDRWGLTHYVATLGPDVLKDTPQDLAAIGVDSTKESSGSDAAKSIPIDIAMKLSATEGGENIQNTADGHQELESYNNRLKARTFSK